MLLDTGENIPTKAGIGLDPKAEWASGASPRRQRPDGGSWRTGQDEEDHSAGKRGLLHTADKHF